MILKDVPLERKYLWKFSSLSVVNRHLILCFTVCGLKSTCDNSLVWAQLRFNSTILIYFSFIDPGRGEFPESTAASPYAMPPLYRVHRTRQIRSCQTATPSILMFLGEICNLRLLQFPHWAAFCSSWLHNLRRYLEVLLTSSTHIKIICGAAEGQIWDGAFLTSCPAWYLAVCC